MWKEEVWEEKIRRRMKQLEWQNEHLFLLENAHRVKLHFKKIEM